MRLAAGLALAVLSGCGPSLGRYEVSGIDLVDVVPQTKDFAQPGRGSDFGPLLRVELRSEFDLVAGSNGDVYAYKIGCGFFDHNEHMIFGPMAADNSPVDLYDAEPAMTRDQAGFARYYLYLPVNSAPRQGYSGGPIEPGYDLRADQDDLCLKIFQAGYFITESRSETIRIPRAMITKTLSP